MRGFIQPVEGAPMCPMFRHQWGRWGPDEGLWWRQCGRCRLVEVSREHQGRREGVGGP